MLAHRAVVGRHIHTSNLPKLLKLEQIALAARPQQESHFKATFFQLTAKIEHRRHSDTSTGKKHLRHRVGRDGKPFAERQHKTQHAAFSQSHKMACALASHSDEKPQLIAVAVNEIY